MSANISLYQCITGPELIKLYGGGPTENFYKPNTLEKWGVKVINSLYVIWKIGVYTSPFLVGIFYQKGYLSVEYTTPFVKLVASLGVILGISYVCKGLGRINNPTYVKFLAILEESRRNYTPETKKQLLNYDFDFKGWPVEYVAGNAPPHQRRPVLPPQNIFQYIASTPLRIIAYLAIHTFGIRLIYPGSIGFLQLILQQSLIQGRTRLIEHNKGERFKLRTCDGNTIDSMFVDARNRTQNGNTLVICSEGNAGFYEIGIMVTAIEAGYSAFGWNHPGFGGSTGTPYPSQEENAIDVVVQFAIKKLGFKLENIVLFGWSIGGFVTSFAAMNYPDVKGVVIDATFDDILPLALNHMPKWWESIVHLAIRQHANLKIYEQLFCYPGPISLIRRTEDEVICLRENDLSSNRGNDLLIKLLGHRYPYIVEENQKELLKQYLSVTEDKQEAFMRKFDVNENECNSLLYSYVSEYSKSYPMKIGDDFKEHARSQMILFLARKYLKDFKATHCVNLPAEMFQMPWDVNVEPDFVYT